MLLTADQHRRLAEVYEEAAADQSHSPLMRRYRMREDMAEINGLLDSVEPQQMRQNFRHVGKANAAKIVRGCWPAIQKVPAALLERGILTGEQVKEIIASKTPASS